MDSIVNYNESEYKVMIGIAKQMVESGYFGDVQSVAKAVVKIQAGKELGLPPFAAMSGIHIIQNKPVLGSNIIATLVKNDPRYDYRIKQCDNTACNVEWFEDGERVGVAGFTIQEAQAAGLTGKDNWKKYTSDMLFARAISRGARRFAPGIFGGAPVYTPDEMDVDTDEDGYINGESVEISAPTPEPGRRSNDEILDELGFEPEPAKQPKHEFGPRPYAPETLKDVLAYKANEYADYEASDKYRNFVAALLSEYFAGDDDRRHTVQLYLFGAASIKDISGGMVKAAAKWLDAQPNPDGSGSSIINEVSRKELSAVYDAAIKAEGQDTLI